MKSLEIRPNSAAHSTGTQETGGPEKTDREQKIEQLIQEINERKAQLLTACTGTLNNCHRLNPTS